jgi:hypothetical protein
MLKVFKSFEEREEFDREVLRSLSPQERLAQVEKHREANYGYFDRTFSKTLRVVKPAWR